MKTPHTAYFKRTKVLVTLRDGSRFIDRFRDKKSGYMIFEERGRIPISDIANTGPYKDRNGGTKNVLLFQEAKGF